MFRPRLTTVALPFLALMSFCAANNETPDPWNEHKFVDAPETISVDKDQARANLYRDQRAEAKTENPPPKKKDGRTYNTYRNDYGSLFSGYNGDPITPPHILERHRQMGKSGVPEYGTVPYLDDVPGSMTDPFPQDYVGVARWNRQDYLIAESKPLNPSDQSFAFKLEKDDDVDDIDDMLVEDVDELEEIEDEPGDVQTIDGATHRPTNQATHKASTSVKRTAKEIARATETVFVANESVQSFQVGPQATFAMNFLGELRGGSFSFGVNGLYVHNRLITLEGWLGYRRIAAGITGENKEVLTLNNLALGFGLGALPVVQGDSHLRVLVGGEFDFNLGTTRSQAGGGSESFSDIHFFALTGTVGWHAGDWGVFGKYGLIMRSISEDHPGFMHIAEIGLIVYLL